MEEFEKIQYECNKKKFVKEQIIIVHLGLGTAEAHHLWSKDGYEYTGVEILEHYVKVALPLSKTRKLPKEAPMEHPRLLDLPTLGTLTSNVSDYYSE